MVLVVEVRERHDRAPFDRQQAGRELVVMLRELASLRLGARVGDGDLEQHHGSGRIRRTDDGARLDVIARIGRRRRRALGKRNRAFDRGRPARPRRENGEHAEEGQRAEPRDRRRR